MVINKNYLINGRAESASRTGDCGTSETSGTGETSGSASRTGDCETGGTSGRAVKNGKAGASGTGGRIGNGLSKIFFWDLVGN